MKYYRKDWILFQEIANDGGKLPEGLIEMKLKEENPEEQKHVPFITKTKDGYEVRCGKNELHPTTEEHHISFIDLFVDGKMFRQNFKFGDKPIANFVVKKGKKVEAVAFCNLHGLYKYVLK